TSTPITESVSTRVPSGSPRTAARLSAWRTIANADARITTNNQIKTNANQRRLERSPNHRSPKRKKSPVVIKLAARAHSSVRREKPKSLEIFDSPAATEY